MIKRIVGGVISVVIGGTIYTVSQTNVVNNFAKNTGMTQQQAQDYANNAKNNLESFSKIGQELVSDGNSVLSTSSQIDCTNYTYKWESPDLSCNEGLTELQKIGNDEVQLGNCYGSLGTNLGSDSRSKINECINDIDTTDADYSLPIATRLLTSAQTTDFQNSNLYNKSVLQAALQSHK